MASTTPTAARTIHERGMNADGKRRVTEETARRPFPFQTGAGGDKMSATLPIMGDTPARRGNRGPEQSAGARS